MILTKNLDERRPGRRGLSGETGSLNVIFDHRRRRKIRKYSQASVEKNLEIVQAAEIQFLHWCLGD
jgi:hypothetical protein